MKALVTVSDSDDERLVKSLVPGWGSTNHAMGLQFPVIHRLDLIFDFVKM